MIGAYLKGVLHFAIKFASTKVACKKNISEVGILACNFSCNFFGATRKLLTKLHSLKAPLDCISLIDRENNSLCKMLKIL